jgi:hypothetical protein
MNARHPITGILTLLAGFGLRIACKLTNDDKVFSTPAVLVGDSKVGTIEAANSEGIVHYKIEFNASTQASRTAVAR